VRVDKILAGLRDKTMIPKDTANVFVAAGCEACNGTGFKGRIGVFEAIVVDEEMDKILRTSPSERDIQNVQRKRELLMMPEDGVLKSLAGMTSLDEVDRVVLIEAGV
jgi:type II secretory ATPase GspE/PulE/Tfp pilus assembly ATPase PilB-like protein